MKPRLPSWPADCWLLIVGLVVYGSGAFNEFVLFDDDLHIFRNPILGANFWDALQYFWSQPHKGLYIPVTYTVWLMQAAVLRFFHPGLLPEDFSPMIFHGVNIVLHLGNALLMRRVLLRYFPKPGFALGGALLFLVHPVQVESVAWATGMKDLVATSFALSAMLFYFQAQRRASMTQMVCFGTALFCYLFSVLAKPACLVLPLVLAGLEILVAKAPWRQVLPRCLAPLLMLAPLALLTSQLQPLERNMYPVPLWGRPFVIADAIVFYLRKLAVPFPLVHDYGRLPKWVIEGWAGKISLGLLLLVTGASVMTRRWRVLGFLVLFVVALGPVSGAVQFAFQNFSTVADHYLYFPIIVPLVAFLVWLERHWSLRNQQLFWGGLTILGCISLHQVTVWRNSTHLFANTLHYNPRSILAHNNLAVQYESNEDYVNALKHYEISRSIAPHFAHHHYNVGNLQMKLERLAEAKENFHQTLRLDPRHSDAHFNLGILDEAEGNLTEARSRFEASLQGEPLSVKARVKLGDLEKRVGDLAAAERWYREALSIDPLSHQALFRLAELLRSTGRQEAAEPFYAQVLRLKPSHPDRERILSYLIKR